MNEGENVDNTKEEEDVILVVAEEEIRIINK